MYPIIIIVFLIILYIFKKKNIFANDNLILEKATFDGQYYQVLKKNNSSITANIIAKIKYNINTITEFLKNNIEKYPKKEYAIINLYNRTKNIDIIERPDDSDEYITSYTLNKGEQMVLCLRSKLLKDIHDFNIILYVVLHELAHIASNNIGHDDEFKSNFIFILKIAIELKLYKQVDYEKYPVKYCGMVVSENLLEEEK
jgi:predicted metal-dependent hydrolase